MRIVRAFIYKIGLRPKRGSIFYDPSLHWVLEMGKSLSKQYLSKAPKED